MLLSYPAMFVVPAVSLAMLIELFRSGTRRQWLAWLGVNVAAAGGVALLFFASARAQIDAAGPHMRTGWEQAFPPLHSAKQMALFLLESHTSEAFAYPAGGARGASSLTTLCWLAALVLLLRGRRFWLATLFTVPLVLNFTAAALHAYPYAGHSRVMLYMAPIFCLLTGLGGAAILSMMKNRRWSARPRPAVVALVLLAAIGGIASVRDFLKPYKETCWQRNRDFARWFWTDKALDAELVCVEQRLQAAGFRGAGRRRPGVGLLLQSADLLPPACPRPAAATRASLQGPSLALCPLPSLDRHASRTRPSSSSGCARWKPSIASSRGRSIP